MIGAEDTGLTHDQLYTPLAGYVAGHSWARRYSFGQLMHIGAYDRATEWYLAACAPIRLDMQYRNPFPTAITCQRCLALVERGLL